jgi:ABC-type lipoprotein export system ATPase subunit
MRGKRTILVVSHEPEIMAIADRVVEVGRKNEADDQERYHASVRQCSAN